MREYHKNVVLVYIGEENRYRRYTINKQYVILDKKRIGHHWYYLLTNNIGVIEEWSDDMLELEFRTRTLRELREDKIKSILNS